MNKEALMADSTTGVWLDKDSGKIVRKAPRRGRQIVAPGHTVTKSAQAAIDLYKANYETFTTEPAKSAAKVPAKSAAKVPAKKP